MEQLDLLERRLAVLGVGRREFMRVAAGVVALGAVGFDARRASASPRPAPGAPAPPASRTSTTSVSRSARALTSTASRENLSALSIRFTSTRWI